MWIWKFNYTCMWQLCLHFSIIFNLTFLSPIFREFFETVFKQIKPILFKWNIIGIWKSFHTWIKMPLEWQLRLHFFISIFYKITKIVTNNWFHLLTLENNLPLNMNIGNPVSTFLSADLGQLYLNVANSCLGL